MPRPNQHTQILEQSRLAQVRAVQLRERGQLLVHASRQRFEQARHCLAATRRPQA